MTEIQDRSELVKKIRALLRGQPLRMGLLVVASPDRGAVDSFLDIDEGRLSLGRAPSGDADRTARLLDDAVSQTHVHVSGGGRTSAARLEDAGSSNGTWVDGRRVETARLTGQEVIRVGDTLFVYCPRPPDAAADLPDSSMVGRSAALHGIRLAVLDCAKIDLVVLLTGESGCGKEVVAKALHAASGRAGDFHALNLGATKEELVQSEIFGHVRGAFTGAEKDRKGFFETAGQGTLLLDEIGETPLAVQVQLLRAIEEKTYKRLGDDVTRRVRARIVAATNRDLEAAEREGTFRHDLLHRLNQLPLRVPPLRDRREDIPLLWTHFLKENAPLSIRTDPDLLEALLLYPWPGNVRELKNEAERFEALRKSGAAPPVLDLKPKILDLLLRARLGEGAPSDASTATLQALRHRNDRAPGPGVLPPRTRPSPEAIRDALARHGGNLSAVGKEMGRKREQIHRWVRRFEIDPDAYR